MLGGFRICFLYLCEVDAGLPCPALQVGRLILVSGHLQFGPALMGVIPRLLLHVLPPVAAHFSTFVLPIVGFPSSKTTKIIIEVSQKNVEPNHQNGPTNCGTMDPDGSRIFLF